MYVQKDYWSARSRGRQDEGGDEWPRQGIVGLRDDRAMGHGRWAARGQLECLAN